MIFFANTILTPKHYLFTRLNSYAQKNVLILSDKQEALNVVENFMNSALSKARVTENFQNPILRLGKKTSNYRSLLSGNSIQTLQNNASAAKRNADFQQKDIAIINVPNFGSAKYEPTVA